MCPLEKIYREYSWAEFYEAGTPMKAGVRDLILLCFVSAGGLVGPCCNLGDTRHQGPGVARSSHFYIFRSDCLFAHDNLSRAMD